MVPSPSQANAGAGGQIDEPVRFPCAHKGSGGGNRRWHSRPIIGRAARHRHPHGTFFHFTTYMAQLTGWHVTGLLFFLVDVSQMGWAGVDLFFILSGYLITGILVDSMGRGHSYRNFIVAGASASFPCITPVWRSTAF